MGKGHRKCEVCGIQEVRHPENKLFFSNFPLDMYRCREWVKAVGNDELVFLPIEKLHEQRSICAKHFAKKDFNKKGNRLKRHAIPTLHLMASPLTDSQLAEFPQHMYTAPKDQRPPRPQKSKEPESISKEKLPAPDKDPDTEHLDEPVTDDFNELVTEHFHDFDELEDNINDTQLNDANLQQIGLYSVPDTQSNAEHEESTYSTKTFSWQKPSEVVPIPADDIEVEDVLDNLSMYCDEEDPSPQLQDNQDPSAKGYPKVHEEFRCNVCDTEISGFRYTCVQCHDFDLCGACESNREHQQHYMLRVPTPRPAAEVQAVLATVRRYLMKTLDPIKQLEQDWDDAISVKSEVKSEEEDCDHEDDEPQNKSLGRDTSNSAGTPSVPTSDREHSDDDDCSMMTDVEEVPVTESPAGECVVSTDCTGDIQTDTHAAVTIPTTTCHVMVQAPYKQQIENDPLGEKVAEQSPSKPHKKKIIMKLADYLKITQDNLLVPNIRLCLSNSKPVVNIAGVLRNKNKEAHSRIKDASVQSQIKLIHVPTSTKQANVSTKFEDTRTHPPIKEITLPTKNNKQIKVKDMQSLMEADVQSRVKLVGVPPKIQQKDVWIKSKHTSLQPQIKQVILRTKEQNTKPQIKEVIFRTKAKDAGMKPQSKGIWQPDKAVPGYECTERGDCIKVPRMATDTSTNDGHKKNATSTDSQHSTNSVPTQSTPSTTHKKILIRVTDFASPAKKVCLVPTSRVTHNQMDSTNLSHITPCSVKLSKLSKPFLNIGQKWSVQPRLPNNDARNKNGEDNR